MPPTDRPRLSGDPYATDVTAVAYALGADVEIGLDAAESAARLAASGPNELVVDDPDPLRRRLLRQFADPLILFLIAAVAIALLAWWAEGASSVPVDALVIAAIIVLNAALGLAQEMRADHALEALADLTQPMSTVVRGAVLVRVRSATLVAGESSFSPRVTASAQTGDCSRHTPCKRRRPL